MTDEDAAVCCAAGKGVGCGDFASGTLLKMAALTRDNPNAASLLLTILAEVGEESVLIVSQATLAKLCECSLETVERAIVDLVEDDWISRLIIGVGEPTPMAYVVNSRINWKKEGVDSEYASFQAQVLISGEDNSYLKSASAST